MEFKVQSDKLVEMLKVVIKGYDPKEDASTVIFNIVDNKLVAIGDNPASYFKGQVEITGLVEEEGDGNVFYVAGDVLRNLTSVLPADAPVAISFSLSQTSRVWQIKYAGNKFSLPILTDSSVVSSPETTKIGMIQAQDFFPTINSLIKLIDTNSAMQDVGTSALHLAFKGEQMVTMATDRVAIAEIKKEFSPATPDMDITLMIKQAQASLLTKAVNPAEVLQLVRSDSSFGYIDANGTLTLVRLSDVAPINYQQLIDKASSESSITVNRNEFKQTLNTIGKFLFAVDNLILTTNPDGTATLSSDNGNVMDIILQDHKGISDRPQVFKFVRSIIAEALVPVDTTTMRIQWKTQTDDTQVPSMIQIVPIDDDGNDEENTFIGVAPIANTN